MKRPITLCLLVTTAACSSLELPDEARWAVSTANATALTAARSGVFVTSASTLIRLDEAGHPTWSARLRTQTTIGSAPGAVFALTLRRGELALLRKYHERDGDLLWERQVLWGHVTASGKHVAYIEGTRCETLAGGGCTPATRRLHVLDAEDGEELWQEDLGHFGDYVPAFALRSDGSVVTYIGGVLALHNGGTLWTKTVANGGQLAVDAEGDTIVLSRTHSSAQSSLIERYTADGEVLWTRALDGAVMGDLTLDGTTVWLVGWGVSASRGPLLMRVDLDDGGTEWVGYFGRALRDVAVDAEHRVYVLANAEGDDEHEGTTAPEYVAQVVTDD